MAGWQCRRWSRVGKVDEFDRVFVSNDWEHTCLRRTSPHSSTWAEATVRPSMDGYHWAVRVPYKTVDSGWSGSLSEAKRKADARLRGVKRTEK